MRRRYHARGRRDSLGDGPLRAGGAVVQHDAQRGELRADRVALLEIPGRTGSGALAYLLVDALGAEGTQRQTAGPRASRVLCGSDEQQAELIPQAPESPEAIVQRQLDAYNARDLEAFLATFAPDAEGFRHPAQPFFSGHAEMRAIYGPVFAGIPDLHSELVARLVLDDHVFDQERVTGGGRQTIEAVAIYQVEGGLIRRVWFVTPTAPAASE